MEGMKKLIGMTLKGFKLSLDKYTINIETVDNKLFEIEAYGDCCSESWFEHIEGSEILIGNKINNVIEHEMPKPCKDDNQGWTEFYGWTLETSKGSCDIEMRNSSNGYYGGIIYVSKKRGVK